MIARVFAKPSATKPQIWMLFALVLTMASVLVALPIPQKDYRWIGWVLGAAVVVFLGGYVVRYTMIRYEYQLYADRLVVLRHFLKSVRITATLSHRSITKILPAADPAVRSFRRHDATVSFSGVMDNRYAVIYKRHRREEALLLECGYPFAKTLSKTVLDYQSKSKGE